MKALRNAKYTVETSLASVPQLRVATRASLDMINRALAEAGRRATASTHRLLLQYTQEYNGYEQDYNSQNDQTVRDIAARLHGRVIKLRKAILTDSNRLNIPGLIPPSLSDSLERSTSAPRPAAAPLLYSPQPITSSSVAPSIPQRHGRPAAPPVTGHWSHQPRRSVSMSNFVEENEIIVNPLTMWPPYRAPPPSSRPSYGAQTPVTLTHGGSGYGAPVAPSHGHSASVASAQTFGHGAAVFPGSRQSYESEQSLASSTGDRSVTMQAGTVHQSAVTTVASQPHAQARFAQLKSMYKDVYTDDQLWHFVLMEQQRQQAHPGQ
ncbi:hypothetical protein AURDEDRAFT_123388 [Auricularia subglabra TFB-10046 SS5]|nr:hypothetical protein AURDEDRAFT_123388 [Auricularia subglabra TFB-10046 SS5]